MRDSNIDKVMGHFMLLTAPRQDLIFKFNSLIEGLPSEFAKYFLQAKAIEFNFYDQLGKVPVRDRSSEFGD
jgi:hypothetical protein